MSLQVKHLVKHFDGVVAVRDLSFELRVGECVALIGPNGAGKSTCFACIAGQQRLQGGEVLWAGERIDQMSPAQRLLRGVARTFQMAQTFEALTVLQNVQLVLQAPHGLVAWDVLDLLQADTALTLLARVGLRHLAQAPVLGLPYGAKKHLELALALAGIHPSGPTPSARLLLLDEPAAGLAGSERADLMALVKSLAHEAPSAANPAPGMAVLYSEHNMDAVFGVAGRVLVLIDGELAAQGSPDEIARSETVRSRYLGRTSYAARPALGAAQRNPSPNPVLQGHAVKSVPTGPAPILSVQHLNAWHGAAQALFNVSFKVNRGELVVLQGLNGAGKSTLLQAIMGLSSRVTGSIEYEDRRIEGWEPHRRAQAGLGYVAEDRRLFTGLSVQANLRLAARGDVATNEEWVLGLFPALKTMLHRPSGQMSGGEQQMLAIARTLMTTPGMLVLDEPGEGLAPVLVENIVAALLTLKAQGMAMLVAEQNNILSDRADRVITLVAGKLQR